MERLSPDPKVLNRSLSSGCKGLAVGGHTRLQGLSDLNISHKIREQRLLLWLIEPY